MRVIARFNIAFLNSLLNNDTYQNFLAKQLLEKEVINRKYASNASEFLGDEFLDFSPAFVVGGRSG